MLLGQPKKDKSVKSRKEMTGVDKRRNEKRKRCQSTLTKFVLITLHQLKLKIESFYYANYIQSKLSL